MSCCSCLSAGYGCHVLCCTSLSARLGPAAACRRSLASQQAAYRAGCKQRLRLTELLCSVDIGKSVAHGLSTFLRSKRRRLTPLLAAGAGAGVAYGLPA